MEKFWYWRIYYRFLPLGLIILLAGVILYSEKTKKFSQVKGYFSFYEKHNEYVKNCDCRMNTLKFFLTDETDPYYIRSPKKIKKIENSDIEKGQLVQIFHKKRRIKQLIVNEENVFGRDMIFPLILIIFGVLTILICVFYILKKT